MPVFAVGSDCDQNRTCSSVTGLRLRPVNPLGGGVLRPSGRGMTCIQPAARYRGAAVA